MKLRTKRERNRWIGLLLAIILSVPFLAVPFPSLPRVAASSDYVSTDTREGRLAVFDDVWETIDERYYDPAFGGIDWNAPRSVFRQAAAAASGSQELYEVLRRMIATLNDAHTRVFSPDEKFDWWNPRFVTIGLTVREIEGVPTVVQVERGSPPSRAGIRPGDEIDSIAGVAASTALSKKLGRDSLSTANRSGRLRAISTLFDGEAGTTIEVGWKRKDGKISSAAFRRYWTQRELGFRLSRREGKYLYLELEAFTQSLALQLVRSLKDKLIGTQGIVLDLRGNGGGDADAMAEIAAVFLGEGVDVGGFTDRAGATFQLSTHSKSILWAAPRAQSNVPLVVLVSERTSSAAEILAAVLQKQRRSQLIGTPTCGCVLAIRSRHTLPDSGVLDVSEFDYRTPSGERLEGSGVRPELLVAPQRQDLYSKRDRAVEAAFGLLKRITSQSHSGTGE